MRRYDLRPPFTPLATFRVVRPMTLGGANLAAGDAVPVGTVSVDRLRQLYDARKIEIIPVGIVPTKAAAAAPAPEGTAALVGVAPVVDAPAAAGSAAPARYRIKHAGMGGFKIIDVSGAPVGPGYKTKAEAEAKIAELVSA